MAIHKKQHDFASNSDHIFSALTNNELIRLNSSGTAVESAGVTTGSFLNISGGTVTGQTNFTAGLSANTLSGGTILSGSTNLYSIFLTAGSLTPTYVQNGLNTYTGGTASAPTVNVSALTINTLTASGTSNFTGALQSGGTDLNSLFVKGNGTTLTVPIWSGSSVLGDSPIVFSVANGTGLTTINSALAINGNLDVLGTATTFHTTTVSTTDNQIILNLSGSYASALYGGIIILSGHPSGAPASWVIDGSGNWSADTKIIAGDGLDVPIGSTNPLSSGGTDLYNIFTTGAHTHLQNGLNTYTGGTTANPNVNVSALTINTLTASGATSLATLSATTMISGSTNLYSIFATAGSGVQSVGANGNLSTGGTATNPTINLAASPSFNSVTASGTSIFTGGLSANTLSGGTILSGSTNLYSIFATAGSGVQSVGQGTNILTGGTATNPTVSTTASLTVNAITASGSSNFSAGLSASTLSGGTILSGSTNLYSIFTTGSHTAVQNGLNTYTGGTAQAPTVNVSALTVNTITASGSSIFTGGLSANTLSGGTILSGSTNLYSIFSTAGSGVQTLGQGTNILTGGTATNPTVSTTASLTVNAITASGSSNFSAGLSASTLSGGTILSGSTNLYNIFVDGVGTTNYIPLWLNAAGTLTDSIITQPTTSGVTVNGSVNIIGDVNVLGTASTFNTQIVQSLDNNILLNYSGSNVSAIGGGITILSGTPGGVASTWSINANGVWSANTGILTSAVTISNGNLTVNGGGAMISGSTNLYGIFDPLGSGVQTLGQGTNILTGGTVTNPTVSTTASLTVNAITSSGSSVFNGGLSANTLSGGTILSGSTNLYSIFLTAGSLTPTYVQNGLNTYTGGTASAPTVNVSALTVNTITASGATSLATLSATTMISGSTNLYSIFAPLGQDLTTASNGLTKSGYNVTLGGTLTAATTVDLSGNAIQFSGQNASSAILAWSGAPFYTRLSVNGSGSQLKTTFGTLGNNYFLASDTTTMNFEDGGTGNAMRLKFDGTNMFVTDNVNSRGLEAAANYHAGYTNRTYVDKEYVDMSITGVTSGMVQSVGATGNAQTGGTSTNPVISVVASPSFNNLTASGNTSLQGTSGTTIFASQFFQMAPYTGANPTSPNNNDVWFYSGVTGTISLNYRVGGVTKSVELT